MELCYEYANFNTNTVFLEIIHSPIFIQNAILFSFKTQLSRFYLKREIESSLRNVVFSIQTECRITFKNIIWRMNSLLSGDIVDNSRCYTIGE
jgi:hypothetical protein